MATVSNSIDMSDPLHENRPIKTNPHDGVRNKTIIDLARQQSATMAPATATATSTTDMIKLESSAICQSTTSTPNSPNKTDARTTANSIHAALPRRTKPQSLESGPDVTGAELLNTTRPDAGNHWTTQNSSTPSALDYTQLQRPSPEQIFSIFPSELPPRPPPKRSFLQRLLDHPARPAPSARTDEDVSNGHTFRTPGIELGVCGEDRCSHDAERLRRLRFGGLMSIGVVLSMAIGIFIYSLVRHAEEHDME